MSEKMPTFSPEPIMDEKAMKQESNSVEQESQQELDPIEVAEQEKTLFQKFEGKARDIAKILSLVTVLSVAPAAVEQAYGKDKLESPKMEDVANAKERAVAFLEKIMNMPDNPRADSPAQNEMMKKRAAVVMIQAYALNRQGISSGRVTTKDVSAGVQELMDNIELYIDKAYGDGNGEVTLEEMSAFRKTAKANTGWQVLSNMPRQHN